MRLASIGACLITGGKATRSMLLRESLRLKGDYQEKYNPNTYYPATPCHSDPVPRTFDFAHSKVGLDSDRGREVG
jgi:hypothetical protein